MLWRVRGFAPLVDSRTASTADVSRRASGDDIRFSFVTVLGGKLTTYRRMAEDAVDLVSRTRGLQAAPSRTASVRLVDRVVPDSGELLDDATGLTSAEVEFAVRVEGAMTVDDVLDRRTRVGLVDADRARCHAGVEAVVARTVPTSSEPVPGAAPSRRVSTAQRPGERVANSA